MDDHEPLRVHVLDVGHGDSIVIEFPGGVSHAIVDCHRHVESNRGFPGIDNHRPEEPKTLSYFRSLVAQGRQPVVEFACLTHPDLDHYKGYGTLLRLLTEELGIKVKAVWDFGASARKAEAMARAATRYHAAAEMEVRSARTRGSRARAQEKLRKARELQGKAQELVSYCEQQCRLWRHEGRDYEPLTRPLMSVWRKDNINVHAVAPDKGMAMLYYNYAAMSPGPDRRAFAKTYPEIANNNAISSGILIVYEQLRVLLGGDMTNEAWEAVLANRGFIDPCCHVIKVSHHGSLKGSFPNGEPLWQSIRVDAGARLVAAISGGYRSGLPHDQVLASLRASQCSTYCTGSISVDSPDLYQPSGVDRAAIDIMYEHGVRRVLEGITSGAGNITLSCYPNGKCEPMVELKEDSQLAVAE